MTEQELREQIKTLEQHAQSGQLKVQYADKAVTYRSLEEVQQALADAQRKLDELLNPTQSRKATQIGFAPRSGWH